MIRETAKLEFFKGVYHFDHTNLRSIYIVFCVCLLLCKQSYLPGVNYIKFISSLHTGQVYNLDRI